MLAFFPNIISLFQENFMTKESGILTTKQKYQYYETAVQCFESDIEFLRDNYKKIYNKSP